MNDDVVQVLQSAKEHVAAGWCQGWLGIKRGATTGLGLAGNDTSWVAPALRDGLIDAVCLEGALWAATQDHALFWKASSFLVRALDRNDLFRWNDADGRTQVEVIDACDAAIRLAKDST